MRNGNDIGGVEGPGADDVIVALCTTSSLDEAKRIAHQVVGARLAACANIIPGVTSIYSWEGAVHEDSEFLLVMKSRRALIEPLREKILTIHTYDVAEFVVLDASAVSEPYARWIAQVTGGRPDASGSTPPG